MNENAPLISMLLVRRSALQEELREIDRMLDRLRVPRKPLSCIGVPRRDMDVLDLIEEVVCLRFELTREELRRPSRLASLVRPRQIAMWLGREFTSLSAKQLGLHWDRDHTTVLHAEQAVPGWHGAEAAIRDDLRRAIAAFREANAA